MNFLTSEVIIICSTQRSGSTMVVEDMRNTGVLGNPEEYFIPWDPSKKDINWFEQLDVLANKAVSSNGVVSVKVMSNQLPRIDQCLRQSWPDQLGIDESGPYPYFRAITKHAKYIFIRRDNILRQAISRGISRQTGINHATGLASDKHFAGNLMKGYDDGYNNNVKYDYSSIRKDIMAVANENLIWDNFFLGWGVNRPLVLRYEEVCLNSPEYLRRIARYTNIELNDLAFDRKMVPLSNKKNELWYKQYLDEVQSEMKN